MFYKLEARIFVTIKFLFLDTLYLHEVNKLSVSTNFQVTGFNSV